MIRNGSVPWSHSSQYVVPVLMSLMVLLGRPWAPSALGESIWTNIVTAIQDSLVAIKGPGQDEENAKEAIAASTLNFEKRTGITDIRSAEGYILQCSIELPANIKGWIAKVRLITSRKAFMSLYERLVGAS